MHWMASIAALFCAAVSAGIMGVHGMSSLRLRPAMTARA